MEIYDDLSIHRSMNTTQMIEILNTFSKDRVVFQLN